MTLSVLYLYYWNGKPKIESATRIWMSSWSDAQIPLSFKFDSNDNNTKKEYIAAGKFRVFHPFYPFIFSFFASLLFRCNFSADFCLFSILFFLAETYFSNSQIGFGQRKKGNWKKKRALLLRDCIDVTRELFREIVEKSTCCEFQLPLYQLKENCFF